MKKYIFVLFDFPTDEEINILRIKAVKKVNPSL